jgi:hypothetical protein
MSNRSSKVAFATNGSRLCEAVDFEKTNIQFKTKHKMKNKSSKLAQNPPFCKADVRRSKKWTDRKSNGFYKAKFKGYEFTISGSIDSSYFYVVAIHLKKDIRYNSLWKNKSFQTFEKAEDFCYDFNYKNHKCLGKDL